MLISGWLYKQLIERSATSYINGVPSITIQTARLLITELELTELSADGYELLLEK
jgi:hypothetical protein